MSEEYISRKAARDILSALAIRHFELSDLFKIYIKALEDADAELLKIPSVDVAPMRHGRWKDRKSWDYIVCSVCSFETHERTPYCPNCGARMDV